MKDSRKELFVTAVEHGLLFIGCIGYMLYKKY